MNSVDERRLLIGINRHSQAKLLPHDPMLDVVGTGGVSNANLNIIEVPYSLVDLLLGDPVLAHPLAGVAGELQIHARSIANCTYTVSTS